MRKVLRVLLSILTVALITGVSYLAMLIYIGVETPTDTTEYSKGDMMVWVDSVIDSRTENASRRYAAKTADTDTICEDMTQYINSILNSSRMRFEIENISWFIESQRLYLTARLEIQYSSGGRFLELPSYNDERELLTALVDSFNSGTDIFRFRSSLGWNYDRLDELTIDASVNSGEVPVLMNSFLRYIDKENTTEETFLSVQPQMIIDPLVLANAEAELKKALDDIEASIRSSGETDPKKLYLQAAKEVNERTVYDEETKASIFEERRSELQWMQSSAYGALIMGDTVCTGYAIAFKAICDRMGLPCWVVSGEYKGEGHAWNIVNINGVNYYIDCTFADTSGNNKWLFMTEAEYKAEAYKMSEGFIIPW